MIKLVILTSALSSAGAMLPAQEFALDSLLGVKLGMPLDRAVAVLLERGYQPSGRNVEQAERGFETGWSFLDNYEGYSNWIETDPSRGLVVALATVPTEWGAVDVSTHARVFLERDEGSTHYSVELRGGALSVTEGSYGQGLVYQILSSQDLAGDGGRVSLTAVEARIRDAAGTPPTCEEAADDRLTLAWKLEANGSTASPLRSWECAEQVFQPAGTVRTRLYIEEALYHVAPLPLEVDVTIAKLFQGDDGVYLSLFRQDSVVERETVSAALTKALDLAAIGAGN